MSAIIFACIVVYTLLVVWLVVWLVVSSIVGFRSIPIEQNVDEITNKMISDIEAQLEAKRKANPNYELNKLLDSYVNSKSQLRD